MGSKMKVKATRCCNHGDPKIFWDKLCTPQQYGICKRKQKCKRWASMDSESLKSLAKEMFLECVPYQFDIEIKLKKVKK